jgi:hypothetical protein
MAISLFLVKLHVECSFVGSRALLSIHVLRQFFKEPRKAIASLLSYLF